MSQETSDVRQTLPTTKREDDGDDGILDSSQPTDRSGALRPPGAAGFEGVSTEELRRRMLAAAKADDMATAHAIRVELQRRHVQRLDDERRRGDELRERTERDREELQAAAQARGHRCDYTPHGCPCEGLLGLNHTRFVEDLRRTAVSPETQATVAALLGYPGPRSAKIRAIFGGTRGNGPLLPGFEWAHGAHEEDWLELIELANKRPPAGGAPQRNPRDGSVREGWVRAVLPGIVGRHRAQREEREEREEREQTKGRKEADHEEVRSAERALA